MNRDQRDTLQIALLLGLYAVGGLAVSALTLVLSWRWLRIGGVLAAIVAGVWSLPACLASGVVITPPGVTLSRPPQSIAIWYQVGCGDSDRFLADWPRIEKLLHERRIGWSRIDCAVPVNCAAARLHGIARLPAFALGGRCVQGYAGLDSWLVQVGLAPKQHTPPAANPPSPLPTLERQPAQQAAHTRFEAALKGLTADQAALRSEWEAADQSWQNAADRWEGTLLELREQLDAHAAQQEDRWRASEGGLLAIAQAQQDVEEVRSQITDLKSQMAELSADPEPSVGTPSSVDLADPADAGGGTGPGSQNEEFHAPQPSGGELFGKWARFGATLAKVGLAVAAPEVSLPLAGISAVGTLAGWMVRRRRARSTPARSTLARRPQRRPAQPAAEATGSGRSEVRPEGPFPRLYEPTHDTPGPWEQRDNGTRVRSAAGGAVPDRFATINPDGAD